MASSVFYIWTIFVMNKILNFFLVNSFLVNERSLEVLLFAAFLGMIKGSFFN